jgi:hypothetical protein
MTSCARVDLVYILFVFLCWYFQAAIMIAGLSSSIDSIVHSSTNIEVPSGTPLTFSYRLVTENSTGIDDVLPEAIKWTYRESGKQVPVTLQGASVSFNSGSVSILGKFFNRQFVPGPLSVSVRITYPRSRFVQLGPFFVDFSRALFIGVIC